MKTIVLLVGLGVGYMLGARRGRPAYDAIARRASGVWRSPTVQRSVTDAQRVVRDNAPVIGGALDSAVGKLNEQSASVERHATPAEELPGNV